MDIIYRRRGLLRAQIRRQCHKHLSRNFQLKSHAELWARETERAIELGVLSLPIEQRTDTLDDVLERYLEEVSTAKRGFEAERYRIAKPLRHTLSEGHIMSLRAPVAFLKSSLIKVLMAAKFFRVLQSATIGNPVSLPCRTASRFYRILPYQS